MFPALCCAQVSVWDRANQEVTVETRISTSNAAGAGGGNGMLQPGGAGQRLTCMQESAACSTAWHGVSCMGSDGGWWCYEI